MSYRQGRISKDKQTMFIDDTFRQFSKHSFNVKKLIRVIFIGKPAVDDRGSRREFFRLLIREVFSRSGLFSGYPEHVVPLHNVQALADNLVGRMIATCVVQGGEAPLCFAKAVADFIVFGHVESCVCLDDIPDYCVQSCLKQVSYYNILKLMLLSIVLSVCLYVLSYVSFLL